MPPPVQVPLLIGVTGHRDLLAEEMPQLRAVVRRYLSGLQSRFPRAPLRLATALGAGADLLVAEEALSLGIECIAVLPLPVESYRQDFEDPAELKRFEAVLGRCVQRLVCRPGDATPEVPVQDERAARYALAGEVISGHCFILLALWDGRIEAKPGGTAHTVSFRFARRAWLDSAANPTYQDLLPNLPPDLVYHIAVSRRDAGVAPGLAPLQEGYRRGAAEPLEPHLPAGALLVAVRTEELNASLSEHAAALARDHAALDLTADLAALPAGAPEAGRIFTAVDALANRMRRYVSYSLYITSALMIVMGAAFLSYGHRADRPAAPYMLFVFLALFLTLLAVNMVGRRNEWHRRYLEYRALAEGLRVELFWAAAGVTTHRGSPAAHRELLKQAEPGLEWIPNVIRAASLMLTEMRNARIPGGVEFAIRHWIGDVSDGGNGSEQLYYYGHAARHKASRVVFAERAAGGFLVAGLSLAIVLAGEDLLGRNALREPLLLGIGVFSLIGAVVEALIDKTADRELQRQYVYMHALFLAARDHLVAAQSDEERRRILTLLGRAALAEHADWLLVHRDRPVYRSRLQ